MKIVGIILLVVGAALLSYTTACRLKWRRRGAPQATLCERNWLCALLFIGAIAFSIGLTVLLIELFFPIQPLL